MTEIEQKTINLLNELHLLEVKYHSQLTSLRLIDFSLYEKLNKIFKLKSELLNLKTKERLKNDSHSGPTLPTTPKIF